MSGIFKRFGRGLLYILVLPVSLVVLSIYSIVGIVMFFVVGIKGLILFFSGRNIFGELPEDVKARNILEGIDEKNLQEKEQKTEPVVQVFNSPVPQEPVQTNTYITNPFDSTTPIDNINGSLPNTNTQEISVDNNLNQISAPDFNQIEYVDAEEVPEQIKNPEVNNND